MASLTFTCVDYYNPKPSVAIRIERGSNVFDLASGKFYEKALTSIPLIPLTYIEDGRVGIDINTNENEWGDGSYVVLYFDTAVNPPRLFNQSTIGLVKGALDPQRVPTVQETASRVADIRIGNQTLRGVLYEMLTLLRKIATKLEV